MSQATELIVSKTRVPAAREEFIERPRLLGPLLAGAGPIVVIEAPAGYGKSTLLQALELGVYNHCPGDGREQVVTDPTAAKIRAEDGRSVAGVDISPFIGDLPGGGFDAVLDWTLALRQSFGNSGLADSRLTYQ